MLYISLLIVSLFGLMKTPMMKDGEKKKERLFRSKDFPSFILYSMFNLFLFNIILFGKLDDYRGMLIFMVLHYSMIKAINWCYEKIIFNQWVNPRLKN